MDAEHQARWKEKSLVRLALSVFSTNVTVLLINLFTGVIIARVLGVEGRGRLLTLQVWPLAITLIFSGGFTAAAVHFSAEHAAQKTRFLGGVAVMSLLIGLASMGIGVPVALWKLTTLPPGELNILMLAFLLAPVMVFSELTSGMVNGLGRIDVGNRSRLLRSLGTLIALAAMYLTHSITLAGIFWATYLPSLVALLLNAKVFKDADLLHVGDIRATLKLWLPYSLAGFVVIFLQTVYLRCDQFLMTMYMDNRSLGLYGNAVTFSELLQQIPIAVSAIIFTNASFQGDSDRDKLQSCARLIRVGIFSDIFLGIAAFFLLPHLLYRLYKPEFVGAAKLFNLLLPGALGMAIGYPIHTFYLGMKKPLVSIGPQLAAVAVALGGIGLALRAKSLEGVCLASSASYIVYCLGMLYYIRRDYGAAAVRSLFPNLSMVRSGWNRLGQMVRQRSL